MHSLEKHWISHWMRTTKEKLITLDQSRPERRPRPLIGQTAAVVARQVCDYLLAAHRRNGRTAPAGRRRCFIGGWRWRPYSEVVFFQDFLFQQKKKGKEKRYGSPLATDTGSTNQELDSFFCCFVDGVSSWNLVTGPVRFESNRYLNWKIRCEKVPVSTEDLHAAKFPFQFIWPLIRY